MDRERRARAGAGAGAAAGPAGPAAPAGALGVGGPGAGAPAGPASSPTPCLDALTYFDLYGLPEAWDLDRPRLRASYARAALAAHPDRYARPDLKRRAEAVGGLLNRAYDTLRDDGARARYLSAARGVQPAPVGPDFLLGQLERREELLGGDDPRALEEAEQYYRNQLHGVYRRFSACLEHDDRDGMAEALARLNFFLSALRDVGQARLGGGEGPAGARGNDV